MKAYWRENAALAWPCWYFHIFYLFLTHYIAMQQCIRYIHGSSMWYNYRYCRQEPPKVQIKSHQSISPFEIFWTWPEIDLIWMNLEFAICCSPKSLCQFAASGPDGGSFLLGNSFYSQKGVGAPRGEKGLATARDAGCHRHGTHRHHIVVAVTTYCKLFLLRFPMWIHSKWRCNKLLQPAPSKEMLLHNHNTCCWHDRRCIWCMRQRLFFSAVFVNSIG